MRSKLNRGLSGGRPAGRHPVNQTWPAGLRRIRPSIQAAAFVCFVALFVLASPGGLLPADLFFRLDPLAGLAGMLAARRVIPALLLGTIIALAGALIFGRAWCGWLCPLGTVLDWTPGRRTSAKELRDGGRHPATGRWRQAKHYLLGIILASAVLGNLALLFLDPITLIYRTMAAAAWPGLNLLISGAEQALYTAAPLRSLVDAFETALRGTVLPMYQPVYGASVTLLSLFAGILALNALAPRFWCRALCPLGALLGVVSKVAWLRRRVGDGCAECHACTRACPVDAIDPAQGFASNPAECTMCLECVPACTRGAQLFAGHPALATWQPYDPSRRQFFASAGLAVAAVGLLGAEQAAGRESTWLIRPPGAQDSDFTSRCIRCGICLKVCPTSGLQPGLSVTGWSGLWTPVLVPRLGPCDYGCNACGQACPTSAIEPLALEDKQVAVIGHAYIDRDRCIPWADSRNCIVCEEMCPLPEKAIKLEEVEAWTPDGTAVVMRPHVVRERCIGCGICEYRCPLAGEAAIRVRTPSDLANLG